MAHPWQPPRAQVWINQGDIILISLRDFQDDKADVIQKYTTDEARNLKAYGELPESAKINESEAFGPGEGDSDVEFAEVRDDEVSIGFAIVKLTCILIIAHRAISTISSVFRTFDFPSQLLSCSTHQSVPRCIRRSYIDRGLTRRCERANLDGVERHVFRTNHAFQRCERYYNCGHVIESVVFQLMIHSEAAWSRVGRALRLPGCEHHIVRSNRRSVSERSAPFERRSSSVPSDAASRVCSCSLPIDTLISANLEG